jgi:dTDP-4-dehydrorhamnose reductase
MYGRSKAAGEEATLAVGSLGTVVRLTKVVAPTTIPLAAWIRTLQAGNPIRAFADLYFCPISLDFAARAVLTIAHADVSGIFQVSGATDISYLHAALHFARRLRVDPRLVAKDRAASHGIPREEIARFTSLDASRYQSLSGEPPPAPFEVLDAVFQLVNEPVAAGWR